MFCLFAGILSYLFEEPAPSEIGSVFLVEDFESMVYPQKVRVRSPREYFLKDTRLPSRGFVVSCGPKSPTKLIVEVVREGYKSDRALKFTWDNRNGVWITSGIWFSSPVQIVGAQQISFMVKTSRPLKLDVTIRVRYAGQDIPFWAQTRKVYRTGEWIKVTVPFRKMGVPGWYIKETGKPSIRKVPANPSVVAVMISPVWNSYGSFVIDDIVFSPSYQKAKPLPSRERVPWEKIRSFVTYYGVDSVEEMADFQLAIIESRNHSPEDIERLKKAGVYVVGYITIGEDDSLHRGNGKGPGGYASWYLDADRDGKPDMNPNWKSYYVNAGDPLWQERILKGVAEIVGKGCDGIFMDTVDTVELYPETREGMISLIRKIREKFPHIIMVQNRGFPVIKDTAPFIDAVMYEDFSIQYDWQKDKYTKLPLTGLVANANLALDTLIPAQKIAEQHGRYLHVLVLDYAEPFQKNLIAYCYARAWAYGFVPYVSTILLDEVYPWPSWVKVDGDRLICDCDGDGKEEVYVWGQWRDGSEPILREVSGLVEKEYGKYLTYERWPSLAEKNLALAKNGSTVKVDSSFLGYIPDRIIDGLRNIPGIYWQDAAWASRETTLPHWIEIDFYQPNPTNPVLKKVSQIDIFWAWDSGRYWASRRYLIQIWDEKNKKWLTVKEVENNDDKRKYDRIVFDKPLRTTRIRIFQPEGCGPSERPNIMWVAEVEVYPEPVDAHEEE